MPTSRSVLIVTSSPDDRSSTRQLGQIATELRRRPDVRVEVWHLRAFAQRWGDHVVDDLRTWWPAALCSAVGLETVAARLRGLRLRAWSRRADPDVVLLDDGRGERVLGHLPRPAVRVARINPELPDDDLEPIEGPDHVELLIVHPAAPATSISASRTIEVGNLADRPDAVRLGSPDEVARARSAIGLPVDEPVMVGWGTDGWLDGPDLFVRVLWAAEQRGARVWGFWSGIDPDGPDGRRLVDEARRCGVADRFVLRPEISPGARLCGDVALLSHRSPDGMGTTEDLLLESVVAGQAVVAFPVLALEDPELTVVSPLDVAAAADAVVAALATPRAQRRRRARRRLDIGGVVDEILALSGP